MEKIYLAAVSAFTKLGPIRLRLLSRYFGSFERVWKEGGEGELVKAGLPENIAAEFVLWREKSDPQKIWQCLVKEKIRLVTLDDADYPSLLKEINTPSYLLYVKGSLKCLEEKPTLAIVGTRKPTLYGRRAVEKLASGLARAGVVLISGLAYGIDSLVHLAAVKAGTPTVGIVGGGLDKATFYPRSNQRLADKMIEGGGAVLSEYPLQTPPLRHNFPARNRLIAGLASGVLVIEAPEGSGALITARWALEENREVFALPGSIFAAESFGPNSLIKQGAKLVQGVEDVLEELGISGRKAVSGEARELRTPEEKMIWEVLVEPRHIDELTRELKLDTGKLLATLTLMEMREVVKNLGGGYFGRG